MRSNKTYRSGDIDTVGERQCHFRCEPLKQGRSVKECDDGVEHSMEEQEDGGLFVLGEAAEVVDVEDQ